jgi:hypothetical protein
MFYDESELRVHYADKLRELHRDRSSRWFRAQLHERSPAGSGGQISAHADGPVGAAVVDRPGGGR